MNKPGNARAECKVQENYKLTKLAGIKSTFSISYTLRLFIQRAQRQNMETTFFFNFNISEKSERYISTEPMKVRNLSSLTSGSTRHGLSVSLLHRGTSRFARNRGAIRARESACSPYIYSPRRGLQNRQRWISKPDERLAGLSGFQCRYMLVVVSKYSDVRSRSLADR